MKNLWKRILVVVVALLLLLGASAIAGAQSRGLEVAARGYRRG
jgi:hypothetical protein